jgi:hypothetical protein
MYWYDHLYLGKKCLFRANRLKYKIENRMSHTSVYLIALGQSSHSVLEVIPSVQLLQDAYPKDQLRIIGMGADHAEAQELLCRIIDEVYQAQGNFDVAAYMEDSK